MNDRRVVVIGLVNGLVLVVGIAIAQVASRPVNRNDLNTLFTQGNYKDAYEGYKKLALAANADRVLVGSDLKRAVECLVHLGRVDEADAMREASVAAHPGNWRLLQAAAESYFDSDHTGYLVAGKFHRGEHRGGGRYVGSYERDRTRALQLFDQGSAAARSDPDRVAMGHYLLSFARVLMGNRADRDSWKLQSLTPLDTLPDYDEDAYSSWMPQASAAPVEADGTPVFYPMPETFAKAKNDGQRWRWALVRAYEANPGLLNTVRSTRAAFLLTQFGTQTILASPHGFGTPDPLDKATAPYAFETLREEETTARLATGIKRFSLPDEFNPIKIYQAIAAEPTTGHGEEALNALASIFENRRQFDRSAQYLAKSRDLYGDRRDGWKAKHLNQILGAWGQFDGHGIFPAGRASSLGFRFRNGRRVHFEAHEVRFDKLLADVKQYLSSNASELDWQRVNIDDVGFRVFTLNQQQYMGRPVAGWDVNLDPSPGHVDRQISVTTPLQKAGVYLVTARMEGGNTCAIIVWIDDTVLVKKTLADRVLYFVADARTGQPVPQAQVELFGWRMVQTPGKNQHRLEHKALSFRSDADGQVQVPQTEVAGSQEGNYQWLASARTAEGRVAHLGFSNLWHYGRPQGPEAQQKIYTITDRPVYRPGGSVRFKFWVAQARYDHAGPSEYGGQTFAVEIHDPQNNKVFAKSFKADQYGGFDGTFELPSDAPLGVYYALIPDKGGGSFRVEEYKKPEFEVSVDAPSKPVMLGEKVSATIKANYMFGGPVAQAKVKYKVTRTSADERWYPLARWDWLFGGGYWWFASDYAWYPGWSAWGMRRPAAWWWPQPSAPPEVVADGEAPIRPDGTLPIEIDTALAKAAHPDQDHRYEITAEVTDQSRRTIVGTGTVLVARRPFSVYTWLDRGHYRTGDTIEASVCAQTLDHKPVAGKGTLRLLQIAYDAQQKPVEKLVEKWDLSVDAEGHAHQRIKAAAPGQYRLSATIDDGQGHSIEGGYVVTVTGERFTGAGFRFNDLEIIPDRKEYRPGDTLRLLINTNQASSTVLLFLRPTDGVYAAPRLVRLQGKSTVEEIGIVRSDMPNIFIEALTVADGKVHNEAREIAVPPESRIADVRIEPSQTTYKPGQKARIKLKLTGADGKPFVGSTVLAVYDKAVEYISGGSNVENIKEFFWSWKRSHQPSTESSLARGFGSHTRQNEAAMEPLGVFGRILMMTDGTTTFVSRLYDDSSRSTEGARPRHAMFRLGALAAPMAPAPAGGELEKSATKADQAPAKQKVPGLGEPQLQAPTIRTNFADTAFWAPALTTSADGTAEVEFMLPESLTTWKVKGWSLGQGTQVGQGDSEIITSKDLLVRLQAPRFFVEKDEVVLSANVHNKLKTKKSVQAVLEFEGSVLQPLDETARTVEIAAGSEERVDWRVKVAHAGQAVIRMKALTDEESDAAQMTFPAYVHGMLKTDAFAGTIRPDQEKAQIAIRVPDERKPDQSRLEIRYSPTLAGALVDALPYLADYPYGCTEQTLNRFLPTVITQKVLLNLGLDLKAIRDKHTNLNAQQIGDARERGKDWQRYEHTAVFDEVELAKRSAEGIKRLADMQLSDGGWGWFSGYGEFASPHTTALVVHGLQIARQNDVKLPDGMLDRGLGWLTEFQGKQVQLLENGISETRPYKKKADDIDALVFMVLTDSGARNDGMLAFLNRDRAHLSVYAKAMFGLALERLGDKVNLALVLQNIEQYVVKDDENQTAYLKLPNEGSWWWWYGSEVETDAFYLKLLARTDPRGDVAPRLVKYLLNNRGHGNYWNSTRDTAFCIEALAEYLKASGEDRPDMSVTIAVDGKDRKSVKITPADLFRFDNALVIEGAALEAGAHTVAFRKDGKGPLYFNAYLTNFTLEDPITRAGLEVKVDRKVYRLVRDDKSVDVAGGRGQTVGQRVERYRRELLPDGATLKSGELVEVELEIESKNDYEYLLFEDYKAAGFEPAEVRSGYNGNDLGAYVEFRDDRVAFFARSLARGKHSVAYRLRAEIPGQFHALPARAQAMYAPELRANSDEIRLGVKD
jgi:hypothetical protein